MLILNEISAVLGGLRLLSIHSPTENTRYFICEHQHVMSLKMLEEKTHG